jgi:hypothetical protein
MRVGDAKEIARQWVTEHAVTMSGFAGAFFHGSVLSLADDAELSPSSDLDVMVVHAAAEPPPKPGKFAFRGVLLEVSSLSKDELRSPEQILGRYQLAGSFRRPGIILDPSGRLTEVAAVVAAEFAQRRWVERRCGDARDNVLRHLRARRGSDPFHDQVTAWLFGTGVLTHVLLVAGLRNPTVRKRYAAARELLVDYGRTDFYEPLLEPLGCAQMSPEQVEHHLAALADAFDAAKTVIETPFFFAADISDVARPIAIDGCRELIVQGLHREAVFWLTATYARCQKVLHHDGTPALYERHDAGIRQLLDDLGIASLTDLRTRSERVEAFLPAVWEVAMEIMAANPEIEDA